MVVSPEYYTQKESAAVLAAAITTAETDTAKFRVAASYQWTAAKLAVDAAFFTADRAYTVTAIVARIDVAGTDAGAVTAEIRKVPSGTAVASGTVLHSGTINVKGTANTNQTITITVTTLAAGESLGFDLTGVSTAAVGCVTVFLDPA